MCLRARHAKVMRWSERQSSCAHNSASDRVLVYTTKELYRNREVFIAKGAGGLDVATWSIMLGHGSWVVRGCQVAIEISCHNRVGCKVRGSRVTTKISGCDRVDCLPG